MQQPCDSGLARSPLVPGPCGTRAPAKDFVFVFEDYGEDGMSHDMRRFSIDDDIVKYNQVLRRHVRIL